MKRLIFAILILCTTGIVGLFLVSGRKEGRQSYLCALEAKGYTKGEKSVMEFEIYSETKNSLICDVDKNTYTLKLDSMIVALEDVSVSSYDIGDYDLIKIKGSMPETFSKEVTALETILVIQNMRFTLTLSYGPTSILKEDSYPLLSVSDLYGSYSYMNGVLILSGINITLTDTYKYLTQLRIGGFAYGCLSKILFDKPQQNIMKIRDIIPSYNPLKLEEDHTTALKSRSLFIPVTYSELYLLRSSYMVLTLDNESYYLDTFDFMANSFDPKEYSKMLKEGVMVYA